MQKLFWDSRRQKIKQNSIFSFVFAWVDYLAIAPTQITFQRTYANDLAKI